MGGVITSASFCVWDCSPLPLLQGAKCKGRLTFWTGSTGDSLQSLLSNHIVCSLMKYTAPIIMYVYASNLDIGVTSFVTPPFWKFLFNLMYLPASETRCLWTEKLTRDKSLVLRCSAAGAALRPRLTAERKLRLTNSRALPTRQTLASGTSYLKGFRLKWRTRILLKAHGVRSTP